MPISIIFFYSMCARTVLNIQWPQLDEENNVKQNFCKTVENVHEILTGLGFSRFQLILDLMENHWTHPTLTQIMSGEEEDDIEDSKITLFILLTIDERRSKIPRNSVFDCNSVP